MQSSQSTNTQEQPGCQNAEQSNCGFWWVVLRLRYVTAPVPPPERGGLQDPCLLSAIP